MLKVDYFKEADYDKIYVFGDLHGRLDLFDLMIDKTMPTQSDLVVILGDSCDRGKESIGLYRRYFELMRQGINIKHLKGNHEKMFYEGYFLGDSYACKLWINNGGDKTKSSICKENLSKESLIWLTRYIQDMPELIISDKSIFVHAGYDATKEPEEQDEEFVLWTRKPFWDMNTTGKTIYYGHTPNKNGNIVKQPNECYAMDVGAVFFDNLKILEIKSKETFEVWA